MAKTRPLGTNFSKGELSPRIQGRPDLAAYFEGAEEIKNWYLMRQGGVARRAGFRHVTEVKDSTKPPILIPFEASVDDSFMLEFGHEYVRFYKNGAQIMKDGAPYEIPSPYNVGDVRLVHYTQSVDVLFMFHANYQQRKLNRIADDNWAFTIMTASPPPSFETDTDVSEGTITLLPGAASGTDVIFEASAPVFLEGDVGRIIVHGVSRALITAFGASAGDTTSPNDHVRCTILDNFPFGTIQPGEWALRLSPQVTLNPDKKDPVGATVTLVAGDNAFRMDDVGKFITIYGGLVKIHTYDSPTQVKGEILSVMSQTNLPDPDAAPAGAWTLEEAAWSALRGFPRTGEFFGGRLVQAGTITQPTTWWMSASDDFENYGVGSLAANAVEYTIASRRLNRIEWVADNDDLFFGTTGAELRAKGGREGEPIGGDVTPLVKKATGRGCAPIQPIVIDGRVIFLDRSRRQIFSVSYDVAKDGFDAIELTAPADHITNTGVMLGAVAYRARLDPQLFFVRPDGQVAVLTYFPHQKVIGFTRLVTEGSFLSVACIPHTNAAGFHDEVWAVVQRQIGAQTKCFVEYSDEHDLGFSRPWQSLQTDCAVIYIGAATTTINVPHLPGKTVDVIANGSYIGQKVVSAGGQVTLTEAVEEVEVGLHYGSKLVSMRPAVEGTNLEGVPRSWDSAWARLYNAKGGKINGEDIPYPMNFLDTQTLYTGDVKITSVEGWNLDGRFTIEQDQPYPMEVLAIFGTLSFGDQD